MRECTTCKYEQDGPMRDWCRLLEREINSLEPPACVRMKCRTCRWWAEREMVCCNADSEWCADFTLGSDACDEWEEGEDEQ